MKQSVTRGKFKAILHGSFGKHFDEIQRVHEVFASAGIEVLAPKKSEIVGYNDGFALLDGEKDQDPRLVELLYLQNLKRLGRNGFSYFVNPDGYIGKSASYELGIAQLTNTRCFYMNELDDHPAYVHKGAVWSPENLVDYIHMNDSLPSPDLEPDEAEIHKLWQDLMVPGSVVAAGAIIEHDTGKTQQEKEILLVKTHKWGHRYSVVGGKVKRNESLDEALNREIKEETGLKGVIGHHIATFDQIQNSGYYDDSVHHIYVDRIFSVKSKKVVLNHEAQDYLWARPSEALQHLDIEPNAKHIVEIYSELYN